MWAEEQLLAVLRAVRGEGGEVVGDAARAVRAGCHLGAVEPTETIKGEMMGFICSGNPQSTPIPALCVLESPLHLIKADSWSDLILDGTSLFQIIGIFTQHICSICFDSEDGILRFFPRIEFLISYADFLSKKQSIFPLGRLS